MTTPIVIPTPPLTPSRADPENFAERGDATMAYLPELVTAANALAQDVYARQQDVATKQTSATTSATAAATSATAAEAAKNQALVSKNTALDARADAITAMTESQTAAQAAANSQIAAATSAAQAAASASPVLSVAGRSGNVTLTKEDVGLGVGGSLNGVPIGLLTPAEVHATTVNATGLATFGGGANVVVLDGGSGILNYKNTVSSVGTDVGLVGGGSDKNFYIYNRENANVVIGSNNSTVGLFSPSGLNINSAPRVWGSGVKALELAHGSAMWNPVHGSMTLLGSNTYENSGYKYIGSDDPAALYKQQNGAHIWSSAPSGTAGDPISFTQDMSLADGILLIKKTGYSNAGRGIYMSGDDGYGARICVTGNGSSDSYPYSVTHEETGNHCYLVLGNGNVQNTNNAYGGLSDIKHKERITDTSPKLPKIMMVRVVDYFLKAQPGQKLCGVIAQELEKFWPGLVEESPDYEEVEISPARTEIKVTKKQAVEYRDDVRYEITEVDGKWTKLPIRTTVEVPLCTEHLLYAEDGSAVMECIQPAADAVVDEQGEVITPAKAAVWQQAIHRVPVTEDVAEDVEIPEVIERRPTGTVTKSVKYSVFVPLLIKAMQEQQVIIDGQGACISDISARLAALEAA